MTFKEAMTRQISMPWWMFCAFMYGIGFGCAALVPVAEWLIHR